MEKEQCEGNCIETHGEHSGEATGVIISGNGWKPTKFNYCQNAIDEDIRRGFIVETDWDKWASRKKTKFRDKSQDAFEEGEQLKKGCSHGS